MLSLFCTKTSSEIEAIGSLVIGYSIFYRVSRVKHGAVDGSAVLAVEARNTPPLKY